ncbi:hypothetical protein WR25_26474 [Diploscapter pachys]|uniref:Uncharacterized protein n=1 Tax=Diploscapter pachys TaxID=2018661 RepID=A0A2A2JDF6_9BILA|nr:hypothetical protein WR25_26474 [Diploscapter pachys]
MSKFKGYNDVEMKEDDPDRVSEVTVIQFLVCHISNMDQDFSHIETTDKETILKKIKQELVNDQHPSLESNEIDPSLDQYQNGYHMSPGQFQVQQNGVHSGGSLTMQNMSNMANQRQTIEDMDTAYQPQSIYQHHTNPGMVFVLLLTNFSTILNTNHKS